VQADDFGSFWDAGAAQKVVSDVESTSESSNTLVVLFVHGWHHNAAPDDPNLAISKIHWDNSLAVFRHRNVGRHDKS
jgi:hypothetical protein